MRVQAPPGGWPDPWPNVVEIASALPRRDWTLVGGLMVQLHAVHKGITAVRPTRDVDLLVHLEVTRGAPRRVAEALEGIGYSMQESADPRQGTAHRWVRLRGTGKGAQDVDQVDVVRADHVAPSVVEKIRGRDMVPIAGGTQALRRTVDAAITHRDESVTQISVPGPFGAVVLKAAAYLADSRDRDRHLFDAAVLLACIDDPLVEVGQLRGSDRQRIGVLAKRLPDGHAAWRALDPGARANAQGALRILAAHEPTP